MVVAYNNRTTSSRYVSGMRVLGLLLIIGMALNFYLFLSQRSTIVDNPQPSTKQVQETATPPEIKESILSLHQASDTDTEIKDEMTSYLRGKIDKNSIEDSNEFNSLNNSVSNDDVLNMESNETEEVLSSIIMDVLDTNETTTTEVPLTTEEPTQEADTFDSILSDFTSPEIQDIANRITQAVNTDPSTWEFPEVDVVYTFVNGSDAAWQSERMRYYEMERGMVSSSGKDAANGNNRYTDHEELRYSLRSIETHMSWARRIYIVVASESQVPAWLNQDHPKINVVFHKDIMPLEVLPVFASVPIEWCLVNIPGIAPYFMNVNDDMFIGKDVESPSTFFHDKMAGDHRVFLESWPFKRSCYCSINLIGNGKCNAQCNNEACGYDHGDCENSEDRAEVLAKHREALLFKATHPGKLDKDAGEFLDSLQYSSSILNREFGHPKFLYGNRRQGQHVPYFTSTKIFKDMISHFAPEVELTLSHRFRHPFDLQYALCYYYYVDATRLYAPSYKQLWHTAFNTADSSEFLFDSRGSQKQFEWEAVQRVRYEKIKQSREYQVLKECVNDPSILAGLVDAPAINVTLIRSCDDAATALLNDYEIRLPIKEIGDGNGVASVQFLMLDDNVGNNIQKLKKLKENIGTFNTLNDDMTIVSDKMEAAYHEFFTDLFPNPSGFEKI